MAEASSPADFEINDGSLFQGHWVLSARPQYSPTPAEKAYLDCLETIFKRVAEEKPVAAELVDELAAVRTGFVAELRKYAIEFVMLAAGVSRDGQAGKALAQAFRLEGGYLDRRLQKFDIPFVVGLEKGAGNLVRDIVVHTRDIRIPEDKQKLKIEIDGTATVMKAVLGKQPATRLGRKLRGENSSANAIKLNEYLSALAGIAKVGLMNLDKSQTPFATLALAGLKDEFVAREAGLIKNAYVWRLGVDALVTIIICVGAAWFLGMRGFGPLVNFLWLWAGAATGAWLSFSIRRVVLGFSDLAVLEDDRLTPELRIVFVVALTTVVGLMFWTGMVSLTIGSFTTDLKSAGKSALELATAAFLVGAFCGIAERSMASAVARRADDFAVGVGKSSEPRK